MFLFSISLVFGMVFLVLSADRFVDGSSKVAKYYGISPLFIGMVIVGFGTSAPELLVSAISSFQGSPGIALGNAYGSNIGNIALILGLASIITPIAVTSQVLKKELPILTLVTLISIGLMIDFEISKVDALVLIIIFTGLMFWMIKQSASESIDPFAKEIEKNLAKEDEPIKKSFANLILGLIVLVISSRVLVFGAVGVAKAFGISDVLIGLTIVAIGTSLPELASSVVAARKGEADIALGNIIGSNLFNTLAVVGIAGLINPLPFEKEILYRDVSVMTFLTVILFLLGYGHKRQGRINRLEGGFLLCFYILYVGYLVKGTL